jgi:hypothetical protein
VTEVCRKYPSNQGKVSYSYDEESGFFGIDFSNLLSPVTGLIEGVLGDKGLLGSVLSPIVGEKGLLGSLIGEKGLLGQITSPIIGEKGLLTGLLGGLTGGTTTSAKNQTTNLASVLGGGGGVSSTQTNQMLAQINALTKQMGQQADKIQSLSSVRVPVTQQTQVTPPTLMNTSTPQHMCVDPAQYEKVHAKLLGLKEALAKRGIEVKL